MAALAPVFAAETAVVPGRKGPRRELVAAAIQPVVWETQERREREAIAPELLPQARKRQEEMAVLAVPPAPTREWRRGQAAVCNRGVSSGQIG